jgi:iron(II)-dependent oxidoreductase
MNVYNIKQFVVFTAKFAGGTAKSAKLNFIFSACSAFLCLHSLSAAGDAPLAGTEIVHLVDGALMVYVPEGTFTMGLNQEECAVIAKQLGYDDSEKLWMWECLPKRKEYVKGFFIDKYEVAIERWLKFVKASPDFKLKLDEISGYYSEPRAQAMPVASIAWNEAQQYANWAGKQLPTEKQWEKAARGTDGRFYPWGSTFNPEFGQFSPDGKGGWDNKKIYTRVGKFPAGASPYGVMDMIGNQYEWTSEWVEPYPNNPRREKMFPYTAHQNACLRGGSWYHGKASLYAAKRFGLPPGTTYYHIGFRTVWEPPEGYFDSPEFKEAVKQVEACRKKMTEQFKIYDDAENETVPGMKY